MFLFIFFFTLSVLLLTTFPVLGLYSVVIGLALLFSVVYFYFSSSASSKNRLQRAFTFFVTIFFAITFSLGSVLVKKKNTQELYADYSSSETSYSQVLTGTVVSGLKDFEYVLQTTNGDYLIRKVSKPLRYGQSILLNGMISPLSRLPPESLFVSVADIPGVFAGEFDYDMRRRTKGYMGDVYYKNHTVLSEKPSFFASAKQQMLDRFVLHFDDNHVSLLSGMLFGDISRMSKDSYILFVESGLVHLVAVSGGNIVMIVLFLSTVLFFVPFKLRLLFILLIIVCYTRLVGLDSSVARALLMGSLSLVALFSGRKMLIYRSLMIARVGLLILNPYALIYDLGFLLSFSALFGILRFKKLSDPLMSFLNKRFANILNEYLLMNIGASLGVLPILMFFIGTTNVLSFVGNVFVLPLVPLIMFAGSFLILFKDFFFINHLVYGVTFVLDRVYYVANISAEYGYFITFDTMTEKYIFLILSVLFFFFGYLLSVRFNSWLQQDQ